MGKSENKVIVALGREYGSCGREIAKMIAEMLDIPFYDKDLIAMAASRTGLSSQLLEVADETSVGIFIQASADVAAAAQGLEPGDILSLNDQLYQAQKEIILQLAEEGSCVIVGRTADYILRDDPSLVTIFVHASMPARVDRVMEQSSLTRAEAAQLITATDRQRSSYYQRYTGLPWASIDNFDISIDSTVLDLEGTLKQLLNFIQAFRETGRKA